MAGHLRLKHSGNVFSMNGRNLKTIIKKAALFLMLTAMIPAFSLVHAAAEGDRLIGIWITPEKDRIRIYRTGDRYYGKPIAHPGQSRRLDVNNPEPRLRNRSLADVMILENFIYDNDKWSDGTVYDPKNGKTYRCVIRFRGDREIMIRGYVGIPLFGRSEVWKRVDAKQ
jgi:uncharacterized protein (DUF2147 family)